MVGGVRGAPCYLLLAGPSTHIFTAMAESTIFILYFIAQLFERRGIIRLLNTSDVAIERTLSFHFHPKPQQYLKAMFFYVDLASVVSIGCR
jgi:hypothetical protein